MKIDATDVGFERLNAQLRASNDKECEITGCLGQRFIAAGEKDAHIILKGTPGNALAAYLNGATIEVFGNAQDAVGDTMNAGCIVIHGNIGDAAGYAMRGGTIYVKGNAGYRAGIHMKEYRDKVPRLVIGGTVGSFLGEYQAGGIIIVLGLTGDKQIVGNFPCTGMHGGKVLLRTGLKNIVLPKNVHAREIKVKGSEFEESIKTFCVLFGYNNEEILDSGYTLITPDTSNPYKQMYVQN